MVDPDFEVPGLDEKGKLLTLTTDTALSSGIADAQFETLDALLAALGLGGAPRLEVEPTWAEQVARVLTDPTVSGLLMGIGTLGLLIELTHPGLIIPGVVGAISLGLFLGGHWVVELAGWEELILLLLGVFLLAAELLILPGFGLAGIGGLLSLAAALTLALIGLPLGVSWELGLITDALSVVVISTFVAAVLLLVAMRFLPQRRFARGLVLQTTLDAVVTPPPSALLGALGVASTDLRPSGKALIDGRLVDVVSQLHFVERGASVQVVEVEGARVVVLERTSQPTHATEQET
jgi:membrane-bound serine protease (ClpP class)